MNRMYDYRDYKADYKFTKSIYLFLFDALVSGSPLYTDMNN